MATVSRRKKHIQVWNFFFGRGGVNYPFKFPVYTKIKMLITSYVSISEFHCFKLCSNFPRYQNQSNGKKNHTFQYKPKHFSSNSSETKWSKLKSLVLMYVSFVSMYFYLGILGETLEVKWILTWNITQLSPALWTSKQQRFLWEMLHVCDGLWFVS